MRITEGGPPTVRRQSLAGGMRVRFADFTFDTLSGQLQRNGQAIPLPGTASEVLRVLLEERPEMVTKEELLRRVWRGAAVEEANLSVAIAKLRSALSDDSERRFIRTYHRKGYAFVAEAVDVGPGDRDRAGIGSVFLLEWNDRRLVLEQGENIVGRNPLRCSICIDEPRVSGRHARIIVSGDTATIEDLESTNHTFVGGVRVTSLRRLADGDVIRLGGPHVTFRRSDVATVRVKEKRRRG
jgi:DNA-binding winged helix-turn-helix (wHTH) protein